jgi:hypothetical protein
MLIADLKEFFKKSTRKKLDAKTVFSRNFIEINYVVFFGALVAH